VAGKIYTFRWYAVNVFGSGPLSKEITVALAAYPAAPTSISKNMALSTSSSINLNWSPVAAGASPGGDILGYVLVAKDTVNATEWTVFDGVKLGIVSQTKITVTNLVPGRVYSFKVTAYNFNGAGATSSAFEFFSCVLPTGFEAPKRISTTVSSMEISWRSPASIGGCDITSYAIFMKYETAPASTFAEVNVDSDPAVRNQPGLNQFTITAFLPGDAGNYFDVFIRAYTLEGTTVDSDANSILLADIPLKPPSIPTLN
jgi:hypothetical protein